LLVRDVPGVAGDVSGVAANVPGMGDRVVDAVVVGVALHFRYWYRLGPGVPGIGPVLAHPTAPTPAPFIAWKEN